MTVTGKVDAKALGMVLPHEHVVTDLRAHDAPGFGDVDSDDVVRVMAPRILAARDAGVTALIECTPGGVGRSALAMRELSVATGFAIVAAAGLYREAYLPDWVREADDEDIAQRLRGELMTGLDGTDILGGFIKVAVSEDGVTPLEERVLRAAGRVAAECGVTIASHTIGGRSALREADIVAKAGLAPERFVWVHAQTEPDMGYARELGARGCYVEYDCIAAGGDHDADVAWLRHLFHAGLSQRVLLSQDAGWYRPGEPNGGSQSPYDYLPRVFLPLLLQRGFSKEDVKLLCEENPKRAFAHE